MSRQPVPFAPETLETIRRAFRFAADRRHDLVTPGAPAARAGRGPAGASAACRRCNVDLSQLHARPRRGAGAGALAGARPQGGEARVDHGLRPRRRAGGGARRLVERAARWTAAACWCSCCRRRTRHAAYFLTKQGVDRLRLLRAIAHRRRPAAPVARDAPRARTPARSDPLEAYAMELVDKARRGPDRPADRPRSSSSSAWSRCCAAAARTTRCWSASPAWARRRWPRAWRCASPRSRCRRRWRASKVYALDLGALVAGTRYRGDFEERVKQVLDALEKQPHAILFIDEIHTLVGAGSASGGTMDAGNLLKPALASGALRCIGSTTFSDVKQSLRQATARCRAASRRSRCSSRPEAEAIEILKGLRGALRAAPRRARTPTRRWRRRSRCRRATSRTCTCPTRPST